MHRSTTVRVSASTRDGVRTLAEADGITLDEEIQRLTRAERQRRFGAALAEPPNEEDHAWLDMAANPIGDDASR